MKWVELDPKARPSAIARPESRGPSAMWHALSRIATLWPTVVASYHGSAITRAPFNAVVHLVFRRDCAREDKQWRQAP